MGNTNQKNKIENIKDESQLKPIEQDPTPSQSVQQVKTNSLSYIKRQFIEDFRKKIQQRIEKGQIRPISYNKKDNNPSIRLNRKQKFLLGRQISPKSIGRKKSMMLASYNRQQDLTIYQEILYFRIKTKLEKAIISQQLQQQLEIKINKLMNQLLSQIMGKTTIWYRLHLSAQDYQNKLNQWLQKQNICPNVIQKLLN